MLACMCAWAFSSYFVLHFDQKNCRCGIQCPQPGGVQDISNFVGDPGQVDSLLLYREELDATMQKRITCNRIDRYVHVQRILRFWSCTEDEVSALVDGEATGPRAWEGPVHGDTAFSYFHRKFHGESVR